MFAIWHRMWVEAKDGFSDLESLSQSANRFQNASSKAIHLKTFGSIRIDLLVHLDPQQWPFSQCCICEFDGERGCKFHMRQLTWSVSPELKDSMAQAFTPTHLSWQSMCPLPPWRGHSLHWTTLKPTRAMQLGKPSCQTWPEFRSRLNYLWLKKKRSSCVTPPLITSFKKTEGRTCFQAMWPSKGKFFKT